MLKYIVETYKTKKDFCKEFGISPQFLSQLLTEKRRVPPKLAVKLEKKHGINPAMLCPDVWPPEDNLSNNEH